MGKHRSAQSKSTIAILCPIKVNSNTIEFTAHTFCYCVLDLLCANTSSLFCNTHLLAFTSEVHARTFSYQRASTQIHHFWIFYIVENHSGKRHDHFLHEITLVWV